jgi:ABC-2 type transport system ATP-binding protein
MNAVATIGLTKAYRRKKAVKGIDLIVPEGACVVLVGANGAGKSTTLQMLLNLLEPSAGKATVLGVPSHKLKAEHFLKIGYASENQELPPLTTTQYFDHLRTLYPAWRLDDETQLRRRLKIPDRQSLRKLSRGERMKACVVAALPFGPELLVMDEPLSGLDPLSREELVQILIERATDITMLISSHDLGDIERLATHVAIMHEGRLVVQEEVETLLTRFREITVWGAGPCEAPDPTWLNLRRDGSGVTFVHSAFCEADFAAAMIEAFGTDARPSAVPMSLSGISSALMRSLDQAGVA